MLAVAYERTQELAKDLRAVGCGDLDVEGHFLCLLLFLSDRSFMHNFWSVLTVFVLTVQI